MSQKIKSTNAQNRKENFQKYKEKWGLDRFEFYAWHIVVLVVEKGQHPLLGLLGSYAVQSMNEIRQLTTLIRRRNNKFRLYEGTQEFFTMAEFNSLQEFQHYAMTLKLAGI